MWRAIELDHLLSHELPSGFGIDVGCGDGRLMQVLREHGLDWRLVGLDPDPAETRLAAQSGQYERVLTCSAAEIPEEDGSFDFAFSNSVLEHIAPISETLAEIARVLKPRGRLIATVPSAALNECLAGPGLLSPILGRDGDYLRRFDERVAHVNLWDEAHWRGELQRVGFGEVAFAPYFSATEVRRWERFSNWTGGLASAMSGKRPIEISRRAGVSTDGPLTPLLRPPARAISRFALRGVGSGRKACLLIDARI